MACAVPPSHGHSFRHGFLSFYHGKIKGLQGYHFTIFCCAITGIMVILINLCFTIWAVATFGVDGGFGTLQRGNCDRTRKLNFWIHLGINILSTLLLGCSNYSMQCLSSPTRKEIDKAHARHAWLDVGIPSFRNLRRLSKCRVALWWLLAISSIPLHLLYNSAVFTTLSTQEYNVFLVSKEFPSGSPFNASAGKFWGSGYEKTGVEAASALLEEYQRNVTSLKSLSNEVCIKTYTSSIISSNSDVILVSDYSSATDSFLVSNLDVESTVLPDAYLSTQWTCHMPTYFSTVFCSSIHPNPDPLNWSIDLGIQYHPNSLLPIASFPVNQTTITGCLSKPVEERCKTQFSLAIIITILVCNLIKVACMGVIVWRQDPEPLVTLGDALASFLESPDSSTKGFPLYGRSRFRDSIVWDFNFSGLGSEVPRWYRTVSKRRWIITNTL